MKEPGSDLVSLPEAARRLGLSPETIRRVIKRGDLPAKKLFGRWRIAIADLDALVAPPRRRAAQGR